MKTKKEKWTTRQKEIRNLMVSAIARGDVESINRYKKMFEESK